MKNIFSKKTKESVAERRIISVDSNNNYVIDCDQLLLLPRYQKTIVNCEGVALKIPDGPSCYYAYKEIFKNEIYKFSTKRNSPIILDCGANIGLSVLYFKKIYPDAQITALEADPIIFTYLKSNMAASGYKEIVLFQKALHHENGEATFVHEGADAGRLVMDFDATKNCASVPCLTLDELIVQQVDFLKIDIEGAETDVILKCKSLHLVKNLFVEYHSFLNSDQRLHQLLAKISECGFRYYISTAFSPKNPFIKVSDYLGMDLQLNISCVRDA